MAKFRKLSGGLLIIKLIRMYGVVNNNIEGMARLTIEPSYTKPASLSSCFCFLAASESPPKNCTLLYIFKTNFEIFEA